MTEFLKILRNYRRRLNLRVAVRALCLALMGLALALHAYYLLWLNLTPQAKFLPAANLFLRLALLAAALFLAWKGVRSRFGNRLAARWLDLQTEHRDDLCQNLFELGSQRADEAVLAVLANQASGRLSAERYRLPGLFAPAQSFLMLAVLIGVTSIWALTWSDFRFALRQFYTNDAGSVAYKQSVEVSPGNLTVGKGQQLVIKVLDPDPRLKHHLYYRWDKEWRELALANNEYVFNALEYSFDYYLRNEVAQSAVFRVECLDMPFVRSWSAYYRHPPHTGLSPATDSLGYGNIVAYKHSEVQLSITANIDVAKAVMKFSDGTSKPMQAVGPREFSTKLQITRPASWYLEMTDGLGRISQPEEKTITIIPDQPPEIRIVFPGEDVILDQSMIIPMIVSATDDFGLNNLYLHYQVNDRPPQAELLRSVISGKMLTLDHRFELRSLGLLPGDAVLYWVQIYDNSPERQVATSLKYRARFPSVEEIFREIERQEELKKEELQSVQKEARDLQKEFEQKRRELLKNDNPQWEDKKQLEKLLNSQQQLNEQVENIAQDFQNVIDKLQANDAVSDEIMQKMQKIQELMQEISNEDLQKALDRFEQALQNINPEELRKAMENLKFSLEDFNKRIDQTLQLLESIKKEQAMDKALQISREMEKMQSALQEKTSGTQESSQRLAQDQQAISEKFQTLQDEMRKIDALLDPAKDKQLKQELNDLRQEMQNGQLQQNLNQSQQALSQDNRSAAQQAQASALEKMRRYTLRLGEMKSSMGSGSQQEIKTAIQNAIRELLIFSKQHEELKSRLGSDPYPIVADLISQYEGLQITLNRLFRVAQVAMFVPPKFYLDLAETNQAYRDVFVNVNEMQYAQVPQKMETILKGLNLMAYDLIQFLNNPSSGAGGASGMQSLMKMLEQMGQEQMAMNFLTEQLMMQLQQQGGRMNAAMQQQMQKLAADQERLVENLKRALQNDPQAQKQGNALQQIISEAEAVARQLRANQLSQDLLNRQENILSRLLDAQRSINKREFSEIRKGEAADKTTLRQPGSDEYDALRRKAMLDESYRLFPLSYQQVILKYLKSLNE